MISACRAMGKPPPPFTRLILKILWDMGLCDRQQGVAAPSNLPRFMAGTVIVLAGVVELSHQARAMLEPVSEIVETLIYAPPELADGFSIAFVVRKTEAIGSSRQIDLPATKLRVARHDFRSGRDRSFARLAELSPSCADPTMPPSAWPTNQSCRIWKRPRKTCDNVPVRHMAAARSRPCCGPGRFSFSTRDRRLSAIVGVPAFCGSGPPSGYRKLPQGSIFRGHSPAAKGHLTPGREDAEIGLRDWRTLLDNYAGEYPAAVCRPRMPANRTAGVRQPAGGMQSLMIACISPGSM